MNATATPGLKSISALDYTIVFARDMEAMAAFYSQVLRFPLRRTLGDAWIEYAVGPNTLTLARPHLTADDAPTPAGAAALQLAFKVEYAAVDVCRAELAHQGVAILDEPADQPWGHRTMFFRDPDGNLVEIYAERAGVAG